MHRLAVIIQRSSRDAIVAETEINLVQIEFEDALFRIGCLDTEGDEHFADLALKATLICEQEVLCDLLRDGGRALHAPTLEQDHNGTRDTFRINAAMDVEIFVFCRDEGLLHHCGDR